VTKTETSSSPLAVKVSWHLVVFTEAIYGELFGEMSREIIVFFREIFFPRRGIFHGVTVRGGCPEPHTGLQVSTYSVRYGLGYPD